MNNHHKNVNEVLKAALNYEKSGYSVIPIGEDKKPLIPWKKFQKERARRNKIKEVKDNPERLPHLRTAWQRLLTGNFSVSKIKELAHEEGLRTRRSAPVSLSTWYAIFNNLFYTGFYDWHGEIKHGNHTSIISLEDFDQAQIILGRKGKARKNKYEHAFNGLIRCAECGCMVTEEPPKRKVNKGDGRVRIYHYLRCTKKNPTIKCGQKYLQVKDLEKQIEKVLNAIQIPKAFAEWFAKELRKRSKQETKEFVVKRTQLQKRYNENEVMIETLLQKLLKGVISDETYKQHKKNFEKEQRKLNQRINSYNTEKNNWLNKIEKIFNFAQHARVEFEKGDLQTKRRIFSALGSNFLLQDKKLFMELNKPFVSIQKGMKDTEKALGSLEPLKNGLYKMKKANLSKVIPIWSE